MDISRRRMLLVMTIAVWLIAWAVWTTAWAVGSGDVHHDLFERALRRILTCAFGALCCGLMAVALDRLSGLRILARMLAALPLCLVAASAYAIVNEFVFYQVAPRWGPGGQGDFFDVAELAEFLFLTWLGLYFAIDAEAKARGTRLQLAEVEAESLRARNRALAAQINPHFLFNALNTLSGLIIEGQSARAESVTSALAALLRRSLENEPAEFITLGDEMDAVRRYLEIELNRFEGRLTVVEDVPDELLGYSIPPMLLQPLAENVMKHGVGRSSNLVRMIITVRLTAGCLKITVADDAIPDKDARHSQGNGIGHSNVRQRLALLLGPRASLTGKLSPNGGYVSTVLLPAIPLATA